LNKKRILIIIALAAAVIVVIAVVQMVLLKNEDDHAEEVNEQVHQIAESTSEPVEEPTAEPSRTRQPTPGPTESSAAVDRDIDFEQLQKFNDDIFAWIEVPGTDIDYPVVHSGDNTYYLGRDVMGEPSKSGAIFLAGENEPDVGEKHLVIYGLNMKAGTMFAQLHKFEDKAFFDENRLVKLYTPEGQYDYEIFAAYVTDDRNILYEADFNDVEYYQEYLDAIQEVRGLNDHVTDIGLTADDNIITLSTCVSGQMINDISCRRR
jgi:sortase B